MNKSGMIGLCMLTSSLSGFATGYFSDMAMIPKDAVVKAEDKPNRLLNGVVGSLCALVGGTSIVVALNRRYYYLIEEPQSYQNVH